MVHIPGVWHKAADALSRHPTGSTSPEMLELHIPDDIPASYAGHSFVAGICSDENQLRSYSTTIDSQLASTTTSALQTLAVTWDRASVATTSDQDMQTLSQIIESGFPQFRHKLSTALQEYYQFHDHLYTVDGIVLYKDCIVIPPSLRQHILAAHPRSTSSILHIKVLPLWLHRPSQPYSGQV